MSLILCFNIKFWFMISLMHQVTSLTVKEKPRYFFIYRSHLELEFFYKTNRKTSFTSLIISVINHFFFSF